MTSVPSSHFWKWMPGGRGILFAKSGKCLPPSFPNSLRFWGFDPGWAEPTLSTLKALCILRCAVLHHPGYNRCFKVFMYQEESFYLPQALIFLFYYVLLLFLPKSHNWGFKNQWGLGWLDSKELCHLANSSTPPPPVLTMRFFSLFSPPTPLSLSSFFLLSSPLPLYQHIKRVP